MNATDQKLGEGLIHKRVLSDVLLDIINNGFVFHYQKINYSQYKKFLKLKPDESSIFKLLYDYNNDINDNNNDSENSEELNEQKSD